MMSGTPADIFACLLQLPSYLQEDDISQLVLWDLVWHNAGALGPAQSRGPQNTNESVTSLPFS